MAINLNQWKQRVFSGNQTMNLHSFLVNVNPPIGDGQELQIRTEAVQLPGIAFMSVDNFSPYGNGKMYNIPYRYNPQEVSMTHIIDKDVDIYSAFRDWANLIVDLNGTSKYAAGFMTPGAIGGGSYLCDMDVDVYDRQHNKVRTVKFIEAFPIVIEPIQMNWGSTEEIGKLNVSYRFTRFEIS